MMIAKLKWWSKVFLLLSFIIYCVSLSVVYGYSFKDNKQKADAAIILGASVWMNQPSPVFKERIEHGVWLYKKGYVSHLIFTGGKYDKTTPSESSVAKQYAIDKGVNKEDIFIEETSRATEQNLINARSIMKKHHINNVLLVSDPFHMSRSMVIASFLGIKAYSAPTPHSAFKTWDTKFPFLTHEALYLSSYILTYPSRIINAYYISQYSIINNYKH
ncbi:protein sanA-like protein [Priestia megaterium]|nr:protein sanA-like protein [Priestia megaterium]